MKNKIVTIFIMGLLLQSNLSAQTGNALNFTSSSSQYVEIPYSAALAPTSAITVEAWVNMLTWGGGTVIISKTEYGGYEFEIVSGNLSFDIGRSAGSSSYDIASYSVSSLSSGWHHLAGTFDGTNTKLYVDGILRSTVTTAAHSIAYYYNNSLILGAEATSGSTAYTPYFTGSLNEVRFWNIARTQTEIQNNMNSTLVGNEAGLVAYYKMSNGSGTTLSDNTTSGSHPGTLHNGVVWTTIPTAPTATAATNIVSATSFSANWDAVAGATKYYLDVSTASDFSSYVTSWKNVDVGTATTYSVNSNLSGGNTYYYRVRVVKDLETSINSNVISVDVPLPVELTSFTATAKSSSVELNWQTATEVNNYGFNVELRIENGEWKKIGFVQGHGNSNSPKTYFFKDALAPAGKVYYRLKQIDFDGKYEYSDVVEVSIETPADFKLAQNYPNPFNPTTNIAYQIPKDDYVVVKVYDTLGSKIATLVNEYQSAGKYKVELNGSNLPSGIYLYSIQSSNYHETKKMILLR